MPLCYAIIFSEGSAFDLFDLLTTRSPSSCGGFQCNGADAHNMTADDEDGEEIDATIFHIIGIKS